MSATTTERRESSGIVGDALRRPIKEAVKQGIREAAKEGAREAMAEQEEAGRRRSEEEAGIGADEGGGRSKFGMLALLAVGVAAMMLWRRRRSGGDGGGMTETIREKSKTIGPDSPGTTETQSAGPDYDPSETETGGGAIEGDEQSDGPGDATAEATSE